MNLKRFFLILAALLSLSLTLLFNSYLPIGLLILACSVYPLICEIKRKDQKFFFIATADLLILLGIFFPRYSARIITALVLALLWITLLIMDVRENRKEKTVGKKILGVLGWVCLAIPVLLSFFLGLTGLFPDGLSRITQFGFGDFPTVLTETDTVREDGVRIYADITYPSEYPNNSLTIYKAEANRATLFRIHGGGLVSGDKNNNQEWMDRMLSEGFNVISMDYALAPQYRYPTQIIQVNEALTFIVENADKWGIETDKIILTGDSAGSQLAGQMCCLLTDPAYADEMGITTIAQTTDFRPLGYISLSGLVDFPEFEHTGVAVIDWLFHVWGASAIGDVDYAVSDAAHEASVVKHVTANFVPTFASDANTGSFAAQGKSLIRKLEALGVETASDFPASERLFHDYELNLMGETESAKHTVDLQVAFIHHLLVDE